MKIEKTIQLNLLEKYKFKCSTQNNKIRRRKKKKDMIKILYNIHKPIEKYMTNEECLKLFEEIS